MNGQGVTLEEFAEYEAVRESGATNIFDIRAVCALSGLDRKTVLRIMAEYRDLKEQYGGDAEESR